MSAAGRAGFRLLRLDVAPAPEPPPPPAAAAGPSGPAAGPAAVAELLFPSDGPIFEGHFPGRPLLPGVAHLAALCEVLEEIATRGGLEGGLANWISGAAAIVEVRKLRFRHEIVPGDRVELAILALAGDGACRFELRRLPEGPAGPEGPTADGRRGSIASEGTVRLAGDTDATRPPTDAPHPGPETVPGIGRAWQSIGASPAGSSPAAHLLPHAPPARLLDAVIEVGPAGIVCAGLIPPTHPLVAAGEAPGYLALELGAQAAAAMEARTRHPGGRPRVGYLVSARDAHLPVALPAGRALRVTAVPTGGAGPLSTYSIEVQSAGEGERLATSTIGTYLREN